MQKLYDEIKNFLENPNDIDKIWDSESIIWVDWREDDEAVIEYVNEILREEDKFRYKTEIDENGDIYITLVRKDLEISGGKSKIIFNPTSRDTTIKGIDEFLKPKNEIRWFMESLGDDTLGFTVLSADDWKKLETNYGKEKVSYYFEKIEQDKKMFDLDMDEVFALIDKRKQL